MVDEFLALASGARRTPHAVGRALAPSARARWGGDVVLPRFVSRRSRAPITVYGDGSRSRAFARRGRRRVSDPPDDSPATSGRVFRHQRREGVTHPGGSPACARSSTDSVEIRRLSEGFGGGFEDRAAARPTIRSQGAGLHAVDDPRRDPARHRRAHTRL
jgi:hypothetical protein